MLSWAAKRVQIRSASVEWVGEAFPKAQRAFALMVLHLHLTGSVLGLTSWWWVEYLGIWSEFRCRGKERLMFYLWVLFSRPIYLMSQRVSAVRVGFVGSSHVWLQRKWFALVNNSLVWLNGLRGKRKIIVFDYNGKANEGVLMVFHMCYFNAFRINSSMLFISMLSTYLFLFSGVLIFQCRNFPRQSGRKKCY